MHLQARHVSESNSHDGKIRTIWLVVLLTLGRIVDGMIHIVTIAVLPAAEAHVLSWVGVSGCLIWKRPLVDAVLRRTEGWSELHEKVRYYRGREVAREEDTRRVTLQQVSHLDAILRPTMPTCE